MLLFIYGCNCSNCSIFLCRRGVILLFNACTRRNSCCRHRCKQKCTAVALIFVSSSRVKPLSADNKALISSASRTIQAKLQNHVSRLKLQPLNYIGNCIRTSRTICIFRFVRWHKIRQLCAVCNNVFRWLSIDAEPEVNDFKNRPSQLCRTSLSKSRDCPPSVSVLPSSCIIKCCHCALGALLRPMADCCLLAVAHGSITCDRPQNKPKAAAVDAET